MSQAQRLIVVSNRVAASRKVAAGGLAVALRDALAASGGTWVGWSGKTSDAAACQPRLQESDGIQFATIDLATEDYNDYYKGFSNRTLWPLFHYRIDLTTFDRGFYEGYQRVNAAFAGAVADLARPDDLVWVHDYHMLLVAQELRRHGLRNRLGFFLHIPFPTTEVLITLPQHRALVEALFAYDLVGFQAPSDLRAFQDYVVHEAGGSVLGNGSLTAFGRTIRAEVFPIGIDAREYAEIARSPEAARYCDRVTGSMPGGEIIIGVDRLDYSKGLVERFTAVECLLTAYPENRGHVMLLQIAPPSRADVPEYIELKRRLETNAGRINGRFAEFDWAPIRYLNRPFSRKVLAGLYRASRIGLVTPFRDGMNLVAKEYVAAQSETNPGVLVLSRFAGAAQQIEGALIVNPYDTPGIADAIQAGLKMDVEERRARWRTMMTILEQEDLEAWRRRFIAVLSESGSPAAVRLLPTGNPVRNLRVDA